jgi:hypothetical protein
VFEQLTSHIFYFFGSGNLSDTIDDIYSLLALKEKTDVTCLSRPALANSINCVFPLLPNIFGGLLS